MLPAVAYSVRIRSFCHRGMNMNANHSWIRGAILFTPLVALTGCMQARMEESREMQTQIGDDEAVVILAKPQIEGAGAEDTFMDCVSKQLVNDADTIKV